MTEGALRVVQFIHPGFEYSSRRYLGPRRQRSGVMDWKPGRARHDRKFMLTTGAAVDPATDAAHRSATLAFWGEWEGPSVFWRVESPGRPLPSVVHIPFRPAEPPQGSVQNTDPLVFGDAFVYSNCMQASRRGLGTLAPGSIILFGRASRPGGQPSFALDTCIVVDRVERHTSRPLDADAYGTNLLHDAVLAPLYSEDIHDELSVYFGQPPQSRRSSPFSFFPARVVRGSDIPLFPRPELRAVGALEGVVNPAQPQSVKFTSGLDPGQRDAIWREVVGQVVAQGCALGHYAPPPPVRDRAAVDRLRAQEVGAGLARA